MQNSGLFYSLGCRVSAHWDSIAQLVEKRGWLLGFKPPFIVQEASYIHLLYLDIQPPRIITCPQHITIDNEENEGYAVVKLKPLDTFDNDRGSSVKQTMTLTMAGQLALLVLEYSIYITKFYIVLIIVNIDL